LVLAKPLIYVFPNKFKLNQTNKTVQSILLGVEIPLYSRPIYLYKHVYISARPTAGVWWTFSEFPNAPFSFPFRYFPSQRP